jgi:hypothetical protein
VRRCLSTETADLKFVLQNTRRLSSHCIMLSEDGRNSLIFQAA